MSDKYRRLDIVSFRVLFLCCAISLFLVFPVNAGVEIRPLNTMDIVLSLLN